MECVNVLFHSRSRTESERGIKTGIGWEGEFLFTSFINAD